MLSSVLLNELHKQVQENSQQASEIKTLSVPRVMQQKINQHNSAEVAELKTMLEQNIAERGGRKLAAAFDR
jgi:hypothetical protein